MFEVIKTTARTTPAPVAGPVTTQVGPQQYTTGLPKAAADPNALQHALSITFAVIAALAVLMIVVAGLRFVTAQGNPQEVSKARNTIVYAVGGLLIALAAEAIVALVLGKL